MLAGMLTRNPVRLDNAPDMVREHLFDVDLAGNLQQQLAHTNGWIEPAFFLQQHPP